MDGSQPTDTSDNQALVVRPREHHSQTPPQTPPIGEQHDRQLLEIDPIRAIQEEIRQLRQQMQRQMEGVQQLVQDQKEESQQGMQRQLGVVQQFVLQHEDSQQRMQQQLEGVQQLVQDQHQESQQRIQQQIDDVVRKSQQSDPQRPNGETATTATTVRLPNVVEKLDEVLKGIHGKDENEWKWKQQILDMDERERMWQQNLQETMDKMQQQ
ncbi:hypothetical protein BGX31_002538, partial [Mortierella sp. GBA43]